MNRYIINHQLHEDFEETRFRTGPNCNKCNDIGPIAPLNLLVGANNSGKSRFMRSLIKSPHFFLGRSDTISAVESLKSLQEYFESIQTTNSQFTLEVSFHDTGSDQSNNRKFAECIRDYKKGRNSTKIDLAKIHTNIENILRLFNQTINEEKQKQFIKAATDARLELVVLFLAIKHKSKNRVHPYDFRFNRGPFVFHFIEQRVSTEIFEKMLEIRNSVRTISKARLRAPQKIYIPALRSANILFTKANSEIEKISHDLFRVSLEEQYSLQKEKDLNLEINTGLSLYNQIKKARNSKRVEREKVDAFCSFLSSSFFEHRKIDIVANEGESDKDQHILLEIDEEERELHHFGDGFQSLLVLLFPIFLADSGQWIFIEEPELHLHPGLQRVFVNQLLSNEYILKKNLKIFIATHSNHILDMTVTSNKNVSFFLFKKFHEKQKNNNDSGKNHHIEIKHIENSDIQLLDELGVLNTSVFQASCSIWVEGPTDRKIIRALLRCYSENQTIENDHKDFIEDLDFAFFLYGGDLLNHYMFEKGKRFPKENVQKQIEALALSNRILLIADKDKGKEKKHKKLGEIFAPLQGSKYYHLAVREIENLFTVDQLKAIIKRVAAKTSPPLEKVEFNIEKLKHEPVGEYLSNLFKRPQFTSKESNSLKSRYKMEFSTEFEAICKFDELSKEAREVAKMVYDFIKESNVQRRF